MTTEPHLVRARILRLQALQLLISAEDLERTRPGPRIIEKVSQLVAHRGREDETSGQPSSGPALDVLQILPSELHARVHSLERRVRVLESGRPGDADAIAEAPQPAGPSPGGNSTAGVSLGPNIETMFKIAEQVAASRRRHPVQNVDDDIAALRVGLEERSEVARKAFVRASLTLTRAGARTEAVFGCVGASDESAGLIAQALVSRCLSFDACGRTPSKRRKARSRPAGPSGRPKASTK